jgi:hypothetical protein
MDEGDYRRASSGSVVLKVGISIVPMRPIAPELSLQQLGNGEKSESVTRPGLTTKLAMVRAQHPPFIHPQGASARKTVIADASPLG